MFARLVIVVILFATDISIAQNRATSNIPTVTLCELVRNPSRYHNRLVRLKASYYAGYHGFVSL